MNRRQFLFSAGAAVAAVASGASLTEPVPALSKWVMEKAKKTGEYRWQMYYAHASGSHDPYKQEVWAEYADLLTHSTQDHRKACQVVYEQYGFEADKGYRVYLKDGYLQDGEQYYLVTPYNYDLIPVKEIV